MNLPNAQQCKANAINALARIADLDPEITGRPRSVATEQQLISIAQVWATLATVPDEIEIRQAPADTGWVDEGVHVRQPKPWRSGGGAGQWNG